jgi:membrane protein implicated in regulation of membrane protease activity
MCTNDIHTTHGGDGVAEDVIVGLLLGVAAMVKAAWWLTIHVAAPLVGIAAVLAYRWTTGLPLRERDNSRPEVFNRRVRVAGRNLLTVILVGEVVWPAVTTIATLTAAALSVGAAAIARHRAQRRQGPRRVKASTGTPSRTTARRARYAITDHRSDTTWTEHTIRDTRRAA